MDLTISFSHLSSKCHFCSHNPSRYPQCVSRSRKSVNWKQQIAMFFGVAFLGIVETVVFYLYTFVKKTLIFVSLFNLSFCLMTFFSPKIETSRSRGLTLKDFEADWWGLNTQLMFLEPSRKFKSFFKIIHVAGIFCKISQPVDMFCRIFQSKMSEFSMFSKRIWLHACIHFASFVCKSH